MSLRGQAATITAPVASTRQFLVVICSAVHFAIPAEIVRSIIQPDEGGTRTTLSAFGINSSPLHLAERFGLSGSYLSLDARIVVCGVPHMHQAYFVDSLTGLYDVQAAQLKPLPSPFAGPERRWFTGMFLFRESVALMVNPEWLFGSNSQNVYHSVPTMKPIVCPAIQEPSSRVASSAVTASEDVVDLLNLEEATDAEDTPWAQI